MFLPGRRWRRAIAIVAYQVLGSLGHVYADGGRVKGSDNECGGMEERGEASPQYFDL